MKRESWKQIGLAAAGIGVFLLLYHLPIGTTRFDGAVLESLQLVRWYAREHIILCVVPALFIAGAISVFVSQASVMRYLGPGAKKAPAYAVASVSGTILAVCSCTVLPLFAGIYRMGAGLGPASAFLYSGPAINVLAILLTARVLGMELGIARTVGAVVFSVVIGLLMHMIFRREETAKREAIADIPVPSVSRPLHQTILFMAAMILILVFANWSASQGASEVWQAVYGMKWQATGVLYLALLAILVAWYSFPLRHVIAGAVVTGAIYGLLPQEPLAIFTAGILGVAWAASRVEGEGREWLVASWELAKQILPLLVGGVLVAGFLLGRPGHEGLVPSSWIASSVGGNSLGANLFASIAGAFMYFATLTEIPILDALLGSGMGKGPALTLLLAGPALSLPSVLVLGSILGWRKTGAYVSLVVVMSAFTGWVFGSVFS